MISPRRKTLVYGGLVVGLCALNLGRLLSVGADGADPQAAASQEKIANVPTLSLARDLSVKPLSGQRDLFRLTPAAPAPVVSSEPQEVVTEEQPNPLQVAHEQAEALLSNIQLIGILIGDGRKIALIKNEDRVEQVAIGDEPVVGYQVVSITSDEMRITQVELGVTGVFVMTGEERFHAIWGSK